MWANILYQTLNVLKEFSMGLCHFFPPKKLRGGSYWNKYKKPWVGNIDMHNISLFLKISLISS